ncbi:sulfotransferase family protein [Gracilimonas mengyeensis]|uniref:Sulfotransferase family protein n=1 Tax=Gracilimonas mengyeensis TaxID=1302730 RepID=A0A521EH49_9BACT|nr:sulfotransferase [Gracilimonas mengyeensis]SMO83235.1 Sulfotransferase family protein [Gracilimonas mengyeensis]
MIQQPIFILGLHKSGTTLLRNLLDGHPDLGVIPFESHTFQLLNYWVDLEYRRQRPNQTITPSDLESDINDFIASINSNNNTYADAHIEGKIDEKRFEDSFSVPREGAKEPKKLIVNYFNAIYKSLYSSAPGESIRFVEKSVENAEFAAFIHKLFPEVKFIRIVRNPYSNIVSFRKFQINNHAFPLMHRLLATMEKSYHQLYKNKLLFTPDTYKIIRYEDLVSKPKETMEQIAQFLGISFEPSLLEPTVLGKPWKGNSMSNRKFEGISSSRLHQWKKEILPMEVYYINKLFPFMIKDFGYKYIKAYKKGAFLKPAPKENPARYVVNRLYRIYLRHI